MLATHSWPHPHPFFALAWPTPGRDRGQVFSQPVGKAGQPVDTAVGGRGDPGLQVTTPPLSDDNGPPGA